MIFSRILFVIATADLFIGPFVSGHDQDCNTAENWCSLTPTSRTILEVSKTKPGRITCMVAPTGQDVWIVNQFGLRVRRDKTTKDYITQISNDIKSESKSFELEITLPEDKEIQGKLKVLQCIAFFYQATYPCRTSIVNIQFVDEEETTTNTTEASTTTTKFDTDAITTVANADTAMEGTDSEIRDHPTNIERRSVRQAYSRIANQRSVEQSDIFSDGAKPSPNIFLLLLLNFALCLIVHYL